MIGHCKFSNIIHNHNIKGAFPELYKHEQENDDTEANNQHM